MIKLRKDTPKRTATAMMEHLYKFMESGEEECSTIDYKENLEFSLKKEGDEYSIEIMGNVST